jgi:hypothetical protein
MWLLASTRSCMFLPLFWPPIFFLSIETNEVYFSHSFLLIWILPAHYKNIKSIHPPTETAALSARSKTLSICSVTQPPAPRHRKKVRTYVKAEMPICEAEGKANTLAALCWTRWMTTSVPSPSSQSIIKIMSLSIVWFLYRWNDRALPRT